jgi:hypothetical protein
MSPIPLEPAASWITLSGCSTWMQIMSVFTHYICDGIGSILQLTILHICMEMPQGNSLCSYVKQAKMSFFFFYKSEEQEGRPDLD